MKRWCGILIVVLLLFVLAGRNWFAPRQAKPMTAVPKKTEYQQQIASLSKQEAPSSAAAVHENASKNKQTKQNSSPETFRVTLLSAVPGRTRFRFELDDFSIQEETINGKTYSHVQLEGAWSLAVKGKPALPVIRRDFVMAKGRNASLRIMDVQEESVVCAPPKPSVGELPRTAEIPPIEEDASVYDGDGVYPSEAVAAGERYVIRGAEGMSVSIRPMRYDFHEGIMVVTRSFEAEITEESAAAEDYSMRDDEWNFRQLLNRRFENSNLLRGGGMDGAIGTMLFIVPDAWAERLADFVAWKERLGYDVVVAGYPSLTGEGEKALASYIQGAYNDSLVSHVVLFGDRGDIPPYEISRFPNSPAVYSPTTDAPYSWVDGDDMYADLFISRMAVSTGAELSSVCAKIMAYERSADDDVWRGTGVFVASESAGSSGVTANRTDSSLIEEERQKLLESNCIDNGKMLYATDITVTADGIGAALNDGCSLVYYLGHGYSYQWATGKFKNTNATALTNGGKLPFVASLCCDSANFAYKNTSLGEAFLRNATGGAVGFLGSTAEVYWNPPTYVMRRLTADIMKCHSMSRLTCQGAYVCSAVMDGIDYIDTVGKVDGGQGTSEFFAKEMHFLGDSSALGRLGGGRKCAVALSRLAATEQYVATVTWEDTGEPVVGAAVCIQTANGMNRYAVRSGDDGTAILPAFAGKTTVMVSDGNWGCVEQAVDIAWAMDTDRDGSISNAEVIAYLNSLDRTTTTADELAAVAEIWERGGGLSMNSRMTIHEAVVTTRARDHMRDNAALREPGGPEPLINMRTATPMEYWTIDGLNKRLDELCLLYPEYCQESYVGRSLEGRDIMALRLSCFEGDGDCPEFMVAAGIHGNERISTWTAMRLAETILADLDGDEADSVYRPLLSRCALWIIPAMNPDGASATHPQRYNAKKHDMNRSFPDGALQSLGTFANGDSMFTGGTVPTANPVPGVNRFPASEVPETTAFMRFCMEHPCKAALHLHSGDVIICYPYGNNAERIDHLYTASPDDEVFRALADAYQEAYDGEIDHKNSCEWYQVDGEAPDWQYRYTGTLALTIELSVSKEPAWLENCESVWKKHKASFASWLGDALVVIGAQNKTRSITLSEGVKVTAKADFKRLMPWTDGKLSIVAKGVAMGVSGGACVMNVACESGMAASLMGETPDGVIGERTESDGSISWLVYSLKTVVDETLDIGIRSTDDVNENDHIVSLVALTSTGEHLLFRRQILLAEKRSFSWSLQKGWNFISSPLLGEELTVPTSCQIVAWNGMRYTDAMDLKASDFTPCNAFWLYSPLEQTISLDGRMGFAEPTLKKGWNAIGGLYYKVLDDSVFTTDGNYNVFTNIMCPGQGYWIFVK